MRSSLRDGRESGWPNLPLELLAEICKLLTRTDSDRLRSVCQSWRNSIPNILGNPPPRFPLQLPLFRLQGQIESRKKGKDLREILISASTSFGMPLRRPYPIRDSDSSFGQRPPSTNLTLQQNTTYILQPNPSNYLMSADSDSSDSSCWLVTAQERFREPAQLQVRLLNPISQQQLKGFSGKSLDCRDYHVTEAFRTYTQEEEGAEGKAKKVAIKYPEPGCAGREDYLVLAISGSGRLVYHRFGDENWTPINGNFWGYSDIAVYRGKFYVVDLWGLLSMINSSMKPVKIAAPVYGDSQKYLAVSLGELYLIDMISDFNSQLVVEIKVYKLNEEEHDWDPVKSIGDRVMFVGVESAFFLSFHNLSGLKGSCIYFIQKSNATETSNSEEGDSPEDLDGHNIGVFNLENGCMGELTSFPGYSKIFWPPPAWIRLD